MKKGHLIAFSSNVLSIVITIMAVQLKAPEAPTFAALWAVYPELLSHLLSFVYLGIFWTNQYHVLESAAIERVRWPAMGASLHLLFWLALIPFAGGWFGKNTGSSAPVAIYGVILLMSAIAYLLLAYVVSRLEDRQPSWKTVLGREVEGWLSIFFYLVAIPLAFASPAGACGIYVLVAVIWLIPDQWMGRRARAMESEGE